MCGVSCVKCSIINSIEVAKTERYQNLMVSDGCWIVHSEFSRGYDLKFAKDAFVFVVDDNKRSLTDIDARQMIGRSSRSFGLATGHVFLIDDVYRKGQLLEQKLKGRRIVVSDDRIRICVAAVKKIKD